MSEEVLKALVVTAEITRTNFSRESLLMIERDLDRFPEQVVTEALTRCRRELTGHLTLPAIIQRINEQDGRPGPEEAWGMIPQDEYGSVVWTKEMAEAYGVCCQLLQVGDKIAARMSFLEVYKRLIAEARQFMRPVVWVTSFGRDPAQRALAVSTAVEKGRISVQRAVGLLPHYSQDIESTSLDERGFQLALENSMKLLEGAKNSDSALSDVPKLIWATYRNDLEAVRDLVSKHRREPDFVGAMKSALGIIENDDTQVQARALSRKTMTQDGRAKAEADERANREAIVRLLSEAIVDEHRADGDRERAGSWQRLKTA